MSQQGFECKLVHPTMDFIRIACMKKLRLVHLYLGCTSGVPGGGFLYTNLDTLDTVSAPEMQHVAIIVGTTALFLASADKTDAAAMTQLMETAREARLATERKNQASPEIIEAWNKWYDEAVASLSRFQK